MSLFKLPFYRQSRSHNIYWHAHCLQLQNEIALLLATYSGTLFWHRWEAGVEEPLRYTFCSCALPYLNQSTFSFHMHNLSSNDAGKSAYAQWSAAGLKLKVYSYKVSLKKYNLLTVWS